MIKKGNFIEMEYTGYVDDNVFDTTDAKIAKENNMYNEKMEYGPIVVCVGQHQILKGIENFIEGKEPGSYDVDVKQEEAFGKKNIKLLHLVPMSAFRKQNINPMPGLQVNIDGVFGIVKNVSGGRIIVDFNHPLAGKDLKYKIKINKTIIDEKEKLASLLKVMFNIPRDHFEIKLDGEKAKVTLKKEIPEKIAESYEKKIKELTKIKEVTFEKKQ